MQAELTPDPLKSQPVSPVPQETDTIKQVRPLQELSISRAQFFKKGLLAFLVCLVTLLAAEGIARLLVVLAHPVQSHAVDFDRKYQLAQTSVQGNKPIILILGDSLIDFAFYPELLQARLKEQGIDAEIRNLAVPGNSFEAASFLLKASIDKGVRPSLVIYDVHPRLYNRTFYRKDPAAIQTATSQDFENSYLGACKSGQLNPIQTVGCFFRSNFYLVGYRQFLKDEVSRLEESLLKPKKRLRFERTPYPKIEVSPGGWAPGYEVHTSQDFQVKFSQEEYVSKVRGEFSQFQWTDEHFRTFREYCRQNNVPVLMVWLPQHPIYKQYYRQLNVDEQELQTRFNDLFRKNGVIFADWHQSLNDPTEFHTPDHVNALGAMSVTERLATLLASDYRLLLKPNNQTGNQP